MQKEVYLKRIGIEPNKISRDLDSLKALQKMHLLRVPFENLDIHWKRPIVLNTEGFYKKIVEDLRGGFCYELNGLFNELLKELGFETRIISARVSDGKGGFGADFDHLAMIVKIEGEEYLADVGFGSFSAEPLKFVLGEEQKDTCGYFILRKFDDEYFEVAKKEGEDFKSEYIFKDRERRLEEFEEMCRFHQTSKESHFTRGKICSIMTENGRKTLTEKTLIETVDGEKQEKDIDSEKDFNRILEKEFGIKAEKFTN